VGVHVSDYKREFGKHVRSLRRARGVTQDALAQQSGLSADTIRRIERGSFAASIDTLRKLCRGLGVAQSTLFEGFELGRTDERRELFDLISSRSDDEITLMLRVMRALADGFDASSGGVAVDCVAERE
jgi:transcriptional regulator with XRE-family HTH domain